MTKEKYMNTLRERLNQLNIEGREDILNDFEAHFTLGKQNGHSDEELMASLGSIDEILESYESVNKPNIEKILIDGHDQKKEFTNIITTIDISARHADTKVTTSKDNGFHVDLYKEGKFLERLSHALIAYQEEAVFYVKVLPLFPHKSSGQYDLSIQIPNDLPNLILNTSSGEAILKDLTIHAIKINSASGDIALNDINAKTIAIEVASSDIKMMNVLGDISLKSASGDSMVENTNGSTFNYQSASGDLKLDGDYETIHLNNVSGDINAQLKTIKQMHVSNVSADIHLKIENNNDLQISSSTLNGTCEAYQFGKELMLKQLGQVQIGEPKTQIKLKTISGNIRLDLE
jgi:DUF4097 and DUF4098 domain-containing protein YvlB